MNISNPEARDYLVELYNQTQGNEEKQVSMHEVGLALGMDKSQAGALGEELIVEGLADLRTLAGGINITSQGLEILQKAGYISVAVSAKGRFQLSGGPLLNEEDRHAIEQLLDKIKHAVSQNSGDYSDMEEIVIDIKTLDVHLLSPKPKTAIVCEILSSLNGSLKVLGLTEIAETFSGVLE